MDREGVVGRVVRSPLLWVAVGLAAGWAARAFLVGWLPTSKVVDTKGEELGTDWAGQVRPVAELGPIERFSHSLDRVLGWPARALRKLVTGQK